VLAWVIGTGPSTWAAPVLEWPVAAQAVLAVLAATVLLGSIGVAQWTVLRRHVARAERWVAWTAGAWRSGRAGRWVPVSVAGSAALLGAPGYPAPLQEVLGTEALGVPEPAAALVGALMPAVAVLFLHRVAGRAAVRGRTTR